MSAPPTLAEVAQDYSEFHVSVEAHNPGKREAQRALGARVLRRVSSSVDFRRFASLGKAEDEKTASQKKVKDGSNGREIKRGAENFEEVQLKSERSHRKGEENGENGQKSPAGTEAIGNRKLRASAGNSQRDQSTAVSAQRLRRKLSERIGFTQTSSGRHSGNTMNTPNQQRFQVEVKNAGASKLDRETKTPSEQSPKKLVSEAGALVKKLSKNVTLRGLQKSQVRTDSMPIDSSPVSESSDAVRKISNRGQAINSKSVKAEPCPREKSAAFYGSRLLRKVSSSFGRKPNS